MRRFELTLKFGEEVGAEINEFCIRFRDLKAIERLKSREMVFRDGF